MIRPSEINVTPAHLASSKLDSFEEVPAQTPAVLVLADGRHFYGQAIGQRGLTLGEIVFNTAMTGYQEVLTDPSYRQQIVVFTYPHIGNYGVHIDDGESLHPQASGLVVRKLCRTPSHQKATYSLGAYLARSKISGIEGIDTRALVRHIRSQGAQSAIIYHEPVGEKMEFPLSEKKLKELQAQAVNYGKTVDWSVARKTGIKRPITLEPDSYSALEGDPLKIVMYDFGVKEGITRRFRSMGCRVSVVPPTFPAQAVLDLKPDGIFLSNGPGDPTSLGEFIPTIQALLGKVPLFGICLGHQLLALSLGAKIEKMTFGHRGANHPVLCLESGVIEITSQNHGFTVIEDSLPPQAEVSHRNLNDDSVEGIIVPDSFAFSVQYHPEACPGPHDARRHFQRFISLMKDFKAQQSEQGGTHA